MGREFESHLTVCTMDLHTGSNRLAPGTSAFSLQMLWGWGNIRIVTTEATAKHRPQQARLWCDNKQPRHLGASSSQGLVLTLLVHPGFLGILIHVDNSLVPGQTEEPLSRLFGSLWHKESKNTKGGTGYKSSHLELMSIPLISLAKASHAITPNEGFGGSAILPRA